MATKSELHHMVDRWEDDPDGPRTCDLLCRVLDELPGQPDGEFSPGEIRDMIDASGLED